MNQQPVTIEGVSPDGYIRLAAETDEVLLIEIDEPYGQRPKGYARIKLTREKATHLIAWLGRFVAGEGM